MAQRPTHAAPSHAAGGSCGMAEVNPVAGTRRTTTANINAEMGNLCIMDVPAR